MQHLLDLPERTIVSVQGRRQRVPIRFTPDPWVQPPLLDLTPNNCACSAAGYAWTASRFRCLPCCLTSQDPEDEQLCVYSLQQEAGVRSDPDYLHLKANNYTHWQRKTARSSPPIPMLLEIVRQLRQATRHVQSPISPLLTIFAYLFWVYMGDVSFLHPILCFSLQILQFSQNVLLRDAIYFLM